MAKPILIIVPTFLGKAFKSLVRDGVKITALKVLQKLQWMHRLIRFKKKYLHFPSLEDRFTAMYRDRYWGGDQIEESFSGPGSSLHYTSNLRRELPELFRKFSIESIFDAPCGDFKWMERVLDENRTLDYTGADVIAPIIESNSARYATARIRFIHLDLTKTAFPTADLMICRDCLFHLCYHDIRQVLQNYVQSNIPYLLTSTHINNGEVQNRDIWSGEFRLIDLFSHPFNFPKDVAFRIKDWEPPFPPREMCLWTLEQISSALKGETR